MDAAFILKIILIIPLICFYCLCSSLYSFSSPFDTSKLWRNRRHYLDGIEEAIKQEILRLKLLNHKVKLFRDQLEQNVSISADMNPVHHPTTSFVITSGFARLLKEYSSTRVIDSFFSNYGVNGIPREKDREDAINSLIRLKHTYGIKNKDLERGIIDQHQGLELSLEDIVDIDAKILEHQTGTSAKIYNELSLLETRAKRNFQHIKVQASNMKQLPQISNQSQENEKYETNDDGGDAEPVIEKHITEGPDRLWDLRYDRYGRLCRGDLPTMTISITVSHMTCRHKPGLVPYEIIKEETLSRNPLIVLLHDAIGDREIHDLKTKTLQLQPSTVYSETDADTLSQARISQQQWVWDEEPGQPELSKTASVLSWRVQRFTGLTTTQRAVGTSAEAFQVLNYGIGGVYEPHVDFEHNEDFLTTIRRESGPRIATFMFYLNRPIAGGYTVFPDVGLAVPPKPGAAVFWYNTFRDGTGDDRTHHAGCPVLAGQKWVANKWIRQYGQEEQRPCLLQPDSQTEYDAEQALKNLKFPPPST